MARLDKSRIRVLCDDYGLCGTVLAIIQEEPEADGRVLFLQPGWRRDRERVWRYREPRNPAAPGYRGGAPARLTGKSRGRWEIWPAPLLGPMTPQWIACPAPACRAKPPQALDATALDVLPLHDLSARVQPLRLRSAKR